eukprot:240221-Chlamydomonas_euryale.AAC.3
MKSALGCSANARTHLKQTPAWFATAPCAPYPGIRQHTPAARQAQTRSRRFFRGAGGSEGMGSFRGTGGRLNVRESGAELVFPWFWFAARPCSKVSGLPPDWTDSGSEALPHP